MPKFTASNGEVTFSMLCSLLSAIGISYSTDVTRDQNQNITGYYIYGSASSDSYPAQAYVRTMWYIQITTSGSATLAYCNNIYFYDDIRQGIYYGRVVVITDSTEATTIVSAGSTVIYGTIPDVLFTLNTIIINNHRGTPTTIYYAVSYGHDNNSTSTYITTTAILVKDFEALTNLNVYYSTLSNYTVVSIQNNYYFKIPNLPLLVSGDGTEGTLLNKPVRVIPRIEANIETALLNTPCEIIEAIPTSINIFAPFIKIKGI